MGGLVLLVACSRTGGGAAGTFNPAQPGVLKVATAEVPAPGFWEGPSGPSERGAQGPSGPSERGAQGPSGPSERGAQGPRPDPDGGFEQGLAEALAARFGLERVEVVTVPFADLIAGQLGGADVALSQLTATREREKVLDFSVPYLAASPAVLVRRGLMVTDLATARKQRWSVRRGSTLERFLEDKVRPGAPVFASDVRQESIDALTDHRVDAVLLDLPVAAAIASRSAGGLAVAGQFASDDSLAAALPNKSPNREALDSAIRAFADDGTLEELARRWLSISVTGGRAQDVPLIRSGS